MFQELSSFLFNTVYYSWSTIKGSRLLKKIITLNSRNYLNMWVTFDVFTQQDDQADDSLKKDWTPL